MPDLITHSWYELTLYESPYGPQCFETMDQIKKCIHLCYQRDPKGIPRIDADSSIGDDEDSVWNIRQGGERHEDYEPVPNLSTSHVSATRSLVRRKVTTYPGESVVGYVTFRSVSIHTGVVPV